MRPRRHLIRAREPGSRLQVLGQLTPAEGMEQEINLCPLQTIEPLFRKHLPRSGTILEAGCGRGRWVFYLRRLGYDVTGIELAEQDVADARAFDPAAPIRVGDVLRTGFADGSFDAVISLGVLEHFEGGPQPALAEVRRVLKPGGLLLVTVPTQNLVRYVVADPMRTAADLLRRVCGTRMEFGEYRYRRSAFARELQESRFTIIETAADDFRPPKNLGLYADLPPLRKRGRVWELNAAGRVLHAVLAAVSPRLDASGTFWVCRKSDARAG